jgi:hypothetical protein
MSSLDRRLSSESNDNLSRHPENKVTRNRCGTDYLVDARECKGVLRASFVDARVIDTHAKDSCLLGD